MLCIQFCLVEIFAEQSVEICVLSSLHTYIGEYMDDWHKVCVQFNAIQSLFLFFFYLHKCSQKIERSKLT